ncbi:MAG: YHYH domain-containing protein, partial [Mycoplasmoidaceae bacterium]|nr:YHYH domain-containing protein [Mycoplasmoidaceae bacterium]
MQVTYWKNRLVLMKKVKNVLLFVLSLTIIILTICTVAFAHSGKTDEDGGHYDNSAGEYHYHHGYPAHQHENGICPYDYNDNTDYRYPNSKNNIVNENSNESKLSQPVKIGFIVTISIILFCVLSYILFLVMRKKIRKKKCMEHISILKPQFEQITNNEN